MDKRDNSSTTRASEACDLESSPVSDSLGNGRNVHDSAITPTSHSPLSIAQPDETPTRSTSWDTSVEGEPSTLRPAYVCDIIHFPGMVNRASTAISTIRNSRFLPKDADTYMLETFKKNKMIIFNQITIPGFDPRHGTKEDVDALIKCFGRRGFEVSSYDDCTKHQIVTILELESIKDLSDYGCFAVVVLTHGYHHGQLMTSDIPIYESEIIYFLKGSTIPSLISKPRLLIVQACRGDQATSLVTAGDIRGQSICRDSIKNDRPYNMANETDLLLFHSTYPGMVSHRGPLEGTWFIQSLCRFINNSNPDDDFLSITRRVIRDVSIYFEAKDNKYGTLQINKQVPVVTTTLSRKLCLNTTVDPESNAAQLNTEGVATRSYRASPAISKAALVQNINENRIVFHQETYGQRALSSWAMSIKYETRNFRVQYFIYLRCLLSKLVETNGDKDDFLKLAIPLLRIAETIDGQQALSITGEETCLQIITFFKSQAFDEKSFLFLYTYS